MHLRSSQLSQTNVSSMSYGRKICRQGIGYRKTLHCRLSWIGSAAIKTGFSSIDEQPSLWVSFWRFSCGFSGAGPHESYTKSGTFFFIFFSLVSRLDIQYSSWRKRGDFDNPSAQSLYYCFDWSCWFKVMSAICMQFTFLFPSWRGF